jgi:death-on-curing protein
MITLPTTEQIQGLHDAVVEASGGATGLRSPEGLSGALGGVAQRLAYEDLDVPTVAALLAGRLAKTHAFVDGNKRISAAVWRLVLALNGWTTSTSPETLARTAVAAATSGEAAFTTLTPFCFADPTMGLLMAYDRREWQ